MGLLLNGQQLHAFFQDPAYWGRGQSFQNLHLRVNDVLVDEVDFQNDWDVSDISPEDRVEVLSGIWIAENAMSPNDDIVNVIANWQAGVVPVVPPSIAPTFSQPLWPAHLAKKPEPETPQKPAVIRPMFMA